MRSDERPRKAFAGPIPSNFAELSDDEQLKICREMADSLRRQLGNEHPDND